MALISGSQLGHFQILTPIGSGGMGEVFLALDLRLDRKVALKVLPETLEDDPSRLKRFEREARVVSALNHPNILTILEFGEWEGRHFLVSEFVDGETLYDRLRRGPLTISETLDIAIQIASALEAAHEASIVHRDIKPGNIMLRRDGIVKVLDFGLAKLTEVPGRKIDPEAETVAQITTEQGLAIGTPQYMSPEQARGRAIDARTDIFSFGAVIYEMSAGLPPFRGANVYEILASILSDNPPPSLTRQFTDLPEELDRIVTKALQKQPDLRYQSSKDIRLDLLALKQKRFLDLELGKSIPSSADTRTHQMPAMAFSDGSLNQAVEPNKGNVPLKSPGFRSPVPWRPNKVVKIAAPALAAILVVLSVSSWLYFHRRPAKTAVEFLAVLPLENLTHDQAKEYLSDGVTETLINSLSQLPHVKVIARNSVFRYKGRPLDLGAVSRELGVQAVLTGRVKEQGDLLTVSVELTDPSTNSQLWGQNYSRRKADLLAVQEDIARQVTETLRLRLNGEQEPARQNSDNPDAYLLYLQGRDYFNRGSEEDLARAIQCFDRAIALDPRYALAYAARGECYFTLGDLNLPMKEAMARSKQSAEMALKIDSNMVEALTLLANIKFQYEWNFTEAERDFKQAIALRPNYAEAHHQYGGYFLPLTGRPLEGISEMQLAFQLDPLNPAIRLDRALPYYLSGRFDEALAIDRQTVEYSPDFFLPHMALGNLASLMGDYAKGITELERAKTLEPTPFVIGSLGHAYAKSGRKDKAIILLAELVEKAKQRYVPPYWIAVVYVGLEDNDNAFAWLEKAYEERSFFLLWIKMDPIFSKLRTDPRFLSLLQRIGLPR